MAQHKSAKKRIRTNARRTRINDARKGQMRSAVRKVEAAIASGDPAQAKSALAAAQPEIHRSVTKGVAHKRTVARKLSRLAKRIKSLSR
ncbi:MAG: 30S ribosomal protein S20 [Alphaproteobacteria bacterium]